MSDNSGKAKKPKKSAKSHASVLGSLPATRPERIGYRDRAKAPAARPAKPKAATTSHAAKRPAKAAEPAAAPRRTPPPPPPVEDGRRSRPPSGPEIVTTAVQAVGELAQIGLTVGTQALRRAARRLPRP